MRGNDLLRQMGEWHKTQGLRFNVLLMDWPDIFMDNEGNRGEDSNPDDENLYPEFGDDPTEDALLRLCRENIPSYQVEVATMNRRHYMRLVTVTGAIEFKCGPCDTITEACLDLLEFANELGILQK